MDQALGYIGIHLNLIQILATHSIVIESVTYRMFALL